MNNRIRWFGIIRVYGLFLVLGYHLFYNRFPGGFLGVDIFFTLSGYLITASVIAEVRKHDRFALKRFYRRRVRRILLPLFLSVIFTLPFLLLVSPDFTVGITKQITAVFGFVENWVEIITGGSYEAQLIPSVYIHTWSLAIEMQFYLIWGLICAVIAAITKRIFNNNAKKRDICFKVSVLLISGVISVCSYYFMQRMFSAGQSLDVIYFSTFTRILPFFIGSFAAVIRGTQEVHGRRFSKRPELITIALVLGVLSAAAVISYFVFRYGFADEFIYQYGFLFTSLLTVVLIYCTQGLHIIAPPEMKEPRFLRAAADMSYNAYLFHWPFYVVFSSLILNHTAASVITLVLTFIYSALVYYGAERVLFTANITGALRYKRPLTAFTHVLVVLSIVTGSIVVYRAPVITSIEEDFAVSYVIQDIDNVVAQKRRIDAINGTPALFASGNGSLQANLIPEPDPDTGVEPPRDLAPELLPEHETELPPESPPEPDREVIPPPDPRPAAELGNIGGVTIIGDSVALGAQAALRNTIPDCYIDAEVSRQIGAGYRLMLELQKNGELKEYVIIALGANEHNNYVKLFTQLIDDLAPGHRLIFVTPFDGRANASAALISKIADWLRELPDRYDFVTVADWHTLISPQANLLAGDKTHMGGKTSRALYTDCIIEALNAASQKPSKSSQEITAP